jgi:hypothetical protein
VWVNFFLKVTWVNVGKIYLDMTKGCQIRIENRWVDAPFKCVVTRKTAKSGHSQGEVDRKDLRRLGN